MRYAQTSVKPASSPHLDQPHSSAQSALKSHSETDKISSNSRKCSELCFHLVTTCMFFFVEPGTIWNCGVKTQLTMTNKESNRGPTSPHLNSDFLPNQQSFKWTVASNRSLVFTFKCWRQTGGALKQNKGALYGCLLHAPVCFGLNKVWCPDE